VRRHLTIHIISQTSCFVHDSRLRLLYKRRYNQCCVQKQSHGDKDRSEENLNGNVKLLDLIVRLSLMVLVISQST